MACHHMGRKRPVPEPMLTLFTRPQCVKACYSNLFQTELRQKTEEMQYVRESLERTRKTLEQEKRLNSAIKQKKVRVHPLATRGVAVILTLYVLNQKYLVFSIIPWHWDDMQFTKYSNVGCVFVKLEELHIATARKPLFHQTQPVACYQHRNQPCML